MKNGDISNKVSSLNIGIRLNGLLVIDQHAKLLGRVKSLFTGNVDVSAISPAAMRLVDLLFYRTSMTVDLVLVGREEERYSDILKNIPYNRILKVDYIYGIDTLISSGVLSYFVTTPNEASLIGSEYCVTLDKFNNLLDKGLKRI